MESPHIEQVTPPSTQESNPLLETLIQEIDRDILEYQKKLATNTFQGGEQERMQKQLKQKVAQAKRIKAGEIIEQSEHSITHHYTFTNPDTNQIEHQEDIHIDLEHTIQEFQSLYKKTNINLPPDFKDTIEDIWNRNYTDIQDAIKQHGFNALLIVPADIPLAEISDKMKMENGYWQSSNFENAGGFDSAVSTGTDKPRLILYHKTQNLSDRPELKQTLNVKAQDINLDEALSLDDYIIASRAYFEETGKHLDEEGWTWTPRTTSGSRFVYSGWDPGSSQLDVSALDPVDSISSLGCRPSRYFY